MRKLLYKEMKLSANPLSYWFITFSAMTMIPRYPILVGSFFICLGIFYTYQQVRECDDITYTVMLPVRKQDVVTAKYLFVLFIECIAFILCLFLTIIRMRFLGDAHAAYLGYIMLVFATFNSVFLAGFFKTAYKIGKPFILFCAVATVIIFMGEILHHIPGLESLNDSSNLNVSQIVIFLLGVAMFKLCTWFSYQKAIKYFERIDL